MYKASIYFGANMQSIWPLATIITFIISPLAHAELFQKLYAGFKTSDQLEEKLTERKLQLNTFEIELNKYDWIADVAVAHSDSFLQSLFSFQSQQTISTTYELGLTKSSFKYGTFEATHTQTTYDISNWTSSGTTLNNFNSDKIYESRNSLSYTYEILNEFQRLEEDEIEARRSLEKISQNISVEQSHYDFFVTYLNAKIQILQDQLTNDSKRRAQKRVRLITRRVRDGLSRGVDLSSAKLSLLTEDENLLKNEANLRESIATLEDILDIKITEKEYGQVNWTFKDKNLYQFLDGKGAYPEVKRAQALNKVSDLNLLRLDEQQSNSLTLSLGYTINAVNADRDKAFSESLGKSENDEKAIALKYSIPIGFETNSLLKTQSKLIQKRNELRSKNKKSEMRVLSKVLAENIDLYSKAIKIVDQKIQLSENIVSENQKLYMRGQVSFEEALRSEENLIGTQLVRVNLYALYEGALARKAFLEGKMLTFLSRYKD